MRCYREGSCGPYEMLSCSECPASKPDYRAKKMVFRDGDERCPHCGAILRNYEGLAKCYCKFCGGVILR